MGYRLGCRVDGERDRKPNEREDADNDDAKPRALTLAKPPVGTREASSSTVPAPVHIPIEAPVRAARALRDEVRAVFERGRKVKGSSDGAEGGARGERRRARPTVADVTLRGDGYGVARP